MPPGAASVAGFIRFARTARRIERTQQLDCGGARILHAMAYTYREIDAASRLELTGLLVGVHNPTAFQNENAFLIGVEMGRGLARRNPTRELGDLFAPEVGMDEVAEQTVLAGTNVFAKTFMHQQARGLAGLFRQRPVDDVTLRVLGATRADKAKCLRASVLEVIDRPGWHKNRSAWMEGVFESVD